MTILHLRHTAEGIRITADLGETGLVIIPQFFELVRPDESFGGYSYGELREIALLRGRMDADELRV